jgi:excisionase family DNA binding protein
MSERLLTVEQVADGLQISVSSIYKAVAAGQLGCFRLGRLIRLSPEEVKRWREGLTVVGGTSGHTQEQDRQAPARRGVAAQAARPRTVGAPDLDYPTGRRRSAPDQRVRPLIVRTRREGERDPGDTSG